MLRPISIAATTIRSLGIGLVVTVAGCGDDGNGTGPDVDPNALSLAVGEVRTVPSSQAAPLRINGGAGGAEFTLIPVHAAVAGSTPLQLQFSGEQLTIPVGPPVPRATAPTRGPSLASVGARAISATANFQAHLNQVDRDKIDARISGARAMYAARKLTPSASSGATTVGAQVTINTSVTSACFNESLRTGRVKAVTQHAVIIADDANPSGGFTDAEYAEIGQVFDALIHPVVTENFGAASDIDGNGGRTVVFFTRAVNELTPRGSTGFINGFFFRRDLLPKSGPNGCAGSNEAELLYAMVPDPNGEVNGNVYTKALVQPLTKGNIAHLSQYLVNTSRRMFVNNAPTLEEDWLNAGLSLIAQELVFYAASGLAPRQNITHQTLISSPKIQEATTAYHIETLRQLRDYLDAPETHAPYGDPLALATRGAVWQFLRYVADRSGTAEKTLWFNLANSTTTGIANLATVTGTDFFTLLREWAIAQYTDDAGFTVGTPFQHPSWNFRSVLSALRDDATFPLSTHVLTVDSPLTLTLGAGGTAYLRFRVAAGRTASVRVTQTGGPSAGFTDLSLSVVRTK